MPGRAAPLLALLLILGAGCAQRIEPPGPGANASAPSPGTVPPAPALPAGGTPDATDDPASDRHHPALIGVDGRGGFPAAPARGLLATAWSLSPADVGAAWRGESAIRKEGAGLATVVAAVEARGADILGGIRAADGAMLSPPAPGEIFLTRNVSSALRASVGDVLDLTADAWPEPRITAGFEMERVRSCAGGPRSGLCILPLAEDGDAQLRLTVPPRSTDLRFHPDVVELGPADFPAFWNGTFQSPAHHTTPFATAALSRVETRPPGVVPGPLEAGNWTIRFRLDANGTRLPGATAGVITYRTPGFAPFDQELFHVATAPDQTRAALANATEHRVQLRVAAVIAVAGAAQALQAGALLSPADARDLLGVGLEDATLLVAPTRGDEAPFRTALATAEDPRLRGLLAWPAVAQAPPSSGRMLLLRAPAAVNVASLPAVPGVQDVALTFSVDPSPGAAWRLGTAILPASRMMALPAEGKLPGSLRSGAAWPTLAAAVAAIAQAPHLVLLSEDLATAAGLSAAAVPYTPLTLTGPAGVQTLYAMGVVAGGPSRTIWVGAPSLTTVASPGGARLVATLEAGVDADVARQAAIAAWSAQGVVPLAPP